MHISYIYIQEVVHNNNIKNVGFNIIYRNSKYGSSFWANVQEAREEIRKKLLSSAHYHFKMR